MKKFKIIAWDVYKKNIKSVSFLIMILAPFLILGIFFLAMRFAEGASDVDKIGIVSEQSALSEQMKDLKANDYTFTVVDSEKAAQKKLKSEDIDAYIVIKASQEKVSGKLYSESTLGTSTEMVLQQFLTAIQSTSRAQALGLTSEQVASLNESADFSREKVSFDEDGKMVVGEDNFMVQYFVSFGATILLMLIILTYAQIIAQEIASEKGTRIMEVILSSTTAQTHYFGKIFGVLMVALTQIAVYVVAFALSFTQIKKLDIVKQALEGVSLEKIFGSFLVFMLLFVILGVLLYSVLAALCGSLVNKAEDATKAALPVTYLSMGGYMLALIMGSTDPNNIIIRVTSYVPFLSSYIMPVRLANEAATTSNAVISVIIMAVFTVGLMMFSASLYKSNVLVYSEGGFLTSLKQSISIMRNERKR